MSELIHFENPSPNWNERQLPLSMVVIHYTGMESAAEALERLGDPMAGVSAHYLIEEDGTVHRLVRGGTLDIGAELRDGASEIVVRAAGPKIAFDPVIGKALDGVLDPGELTSRTAPAHMIQQLASAQGGGLQYALSDDALVMGAVLPG